MTTLCGVMITASHNHKDDNGVKIVEQDGKTKKVRCFASSGEMIDA